MPDPSRVERARAVLARTGLRLLGAGGEGVVFTDGEWVFKVFDAWPADETARRVAALGLFVGRFGGARHLLPLVSLSEGDVPVLVQAFRESTAWAGRPEGAMVGFLRECLSERVVYHCVNPSNFRVLENGDLALVDYGADLASFSWKDWVYMARRAWISLQCADAPLLKVLLRSALADWAVPALDGFESFLDGVLAGAPPLPELTEPTHASTPIVRPVDRSATLLIKVCFQEGDTLLPMVRHLVQQLEGPHRFAERLVLLDPRTERFPRQYSLPRPDLAQAALAQLLREGTIDRVEVAPEAGDAVRAVMSEWFGLDTPLPATAEGVPVASQLWAFERVSTEFVLQVDADAMICRRDPQHPFLLEMQEALRANADAVSVGFQVAHARGFTAPYAAPVGDYCPEVRNGLLHLARLRALRPLPNTLRDGRVVRTWYRAVQQAQRERGLRSLRGGDARTFYVHPMNVNKVDRVGWFDTLDLVEQDLLPSIQYERVDLAGVTSDWRPVGRAEEHVFLIHVTAQTVVGLDALWESIQAQARGDWGVLIVDMSFDERVERLARARPDRVSLARNRILLDVGAAVRHALRRCVDEPEAIVIPLHANDCLLGGAALTMLRRATMDGADVVHGYILEGGRCVVAPIAARLSVLGDIEGDDVVGAILDGLPPTVREPVRGPILLRAALAPVLVGPRDAPVARPSAPARPSPVGRVSNALIALGHEDEWVAFVRHAHKVAGSPWLSLSENRARGLSPEGVDECASFGRALNTPPDLILSSPVARAEETASHIAAACRVMPEVRVVPELLCGAFTDHARWLELKRTMGWEGLVRAWLEDQLPAGVLTPAALAIADTLAAVRAHAAETHARRVIVVTQGYVNTALFWEMERVLDFSGGPLYGFVRRCRPGRVGEEA